jgi:polysaccharide deacetylase family protein (PEP-CTERM system associated)
MKKYAVLSLDVEDWYHLDYFSTSQVNKAYSMLDGVNNFLEIVENHGISSTLFTLSDVAPLVKNELIQAVKNNHEVSSHGLSHKRPLTLKIDDFIDDISLSKSKLEEIIGTKVLGYRAPCFSMSNRLTEELVKAGYQYDSSAINFSSHPLYGGIDLSNFEKKLDNVYQNGLLTEFELPTANILNRHIPISGGGYLRIFPWIMMKNLIDNFLKKHQTYFLYIHPFELSKKAMPKVDNISLLKNFRFQYGQSKTPEKLNKLIELLKSNDFEFVTFEALMNISKKEHYS